VRRRLLRLLDPLLQSAPATRAVMIVVRLWASSTARFNPAEGLRRLLVLDDVLEGRIDALAIELDDGVHAKHRLTGYHDFFVEHVRSDERVLDVGCGKGELAYDVAARTGAEVTGLDVDAAKLAFARQRFHAPGLEFVEGDALVWEPDEPYDVVILSNVLEHIAPRVDLLRRLRETTGAQRFLIRVPSAERDWIVPLRRELGLSHFSDPTHETEYTEASLNAELAAAGLVPSDLVQRWGELWVVASAG
jgi:SAM-dependent methyltransferase